MLLEMIISLTIFAFSTVSISTLMARAADLNHKTKIELFVSDLIDIEIKNAVSQKTLSDSINDKNINEYNCVITTETTQIKNLYNQNSEILDQIYKIKVVARYFDGTEWLIKSSETWRYNRMYQR